MCGRPLDDLLSLEEMILSNQLQHSVTAAIQLSGEVNDLLALHRANMRGALVNVGNETHIAPSQCA